MKHSIERICPERDYETVLAESRPTQSELIRWKYVEKAREQSNQSARLRN